MSGNTVTKVRFVLCGDFFTDFCRDLVMEGKWQRAVEVMKEDLHGINYDQIIQVLKGEMMFTGDSNTGLDMAPDDRHEKLKKYHEQIDFLYRGVYQTPGTYEFFQVYAIVDNWGPKDLMDMGRASACESDEDFARARSKHYRESINDRVEILRAGIGPSKAKFFKIVLARPIAPPPMWLKFPFSHNDAVSAIPERQLVWTGHQQVYGKDYSINYNPKNLEDYGPPIPARKAPKGGMTWSEGQDPIGKKIVKLCDDFDEFCETNPQAKQLLEQGEKLLKGIKKLQHPSIEDEEARYAEEDRRWKEKLEMIGHAVKQRADAMEDAEPGTGWYEFEHKIHRSYKDEQAGKPMITVKLRVPKLPFLWWCLRRTGMAEKVLAPWQPISESGIKMPCDDPWHTDWLLGGGYDIERFGDKAQAYEDMMSAAYSEAFRQQEVLLDFKCAVLCGEGFVFGVVEHPKKGEPCRGKEAIAVIPNAGPDYLDAALTAQAVIVEQGGTMAHLVTVLRPKGVVIVREEGAMKKYSDGTRLSVNTKEGSINVRER